MDRRDFVATGVAGAGLAGWGWTSAAGHARDAQEADSVRERFPRLASQTYLNAAGGTPLGSFAEEGMRRYLDFIRLGPDEGRSAYVGEVMDGVRGRFAALMGAAEREVGLIGCTKAGEQLVLDGLPALRRGGNVVTNDLHFSGSLHNYEGLRRAGIDVRIVRADEQFAVSAERMADAIDARTALVAVSLVSNVNGHREPLAALSSEAHDRDAIVFADVIQAVGAIPIDVDALGIDVAAASSYKWLFGIHGAGFLYVRDSLQGSGVLPDRLFPGHVARQYGPWTDAPASEPYRYDPPASATRYQPGHVSYLGYAAVYEGMRFIEEMGGPEALQAHAATLSSRLLDAVDGDRYRLLTPDPTTSPILSFEARSVDGLRERLGGAGVVVGVGGDMDRLVRVSPSIYNHADDIDRLAEALEA